MELRSETAWKKAAACEAHARMTKDEILRAKFERLRDSWIRIANNAEVTAVARDSCGGSRRQLDHQVATGAS
jgi:hypothetical protein